jgi:hypothetical protein
MIDLTVVKLPKGSAILLTANIGGATTSISNPNHTDVYTDTFPDGITIDMTIDKFYNLWLENLVTDYEVIEVGSNENGEIH